MDQMLTRMVAIKENMDPRGVKWAVNKVKGTALYVIGVAEGNKLSQLPEQFRGQFTKTTLAQKILDKYLEEAWNASDKATERLDKKAGRDKQVEE